MKFLLAIPCLFLLAFNVSAQSADVHYYGPFKQYHIIRAAPAPAMQQQTDPAVLAALANLQAQNAQILAQLQHQQLLQSMPKQMAPIAYGPSYSPPVLGAPSYTPPVLGAPSYTPPVLGAPSYTPPVLGAPSYTPPVIAAPNFAPPVLGSPKTSGPVRFTLALDRR